MDESVLGYKIDITCDSSGDATAYIPVTSGALYALNFTKGASALANTADVTVSTDGLYASTILTLTNLDITSTAATYYPRVASCGNTGSANSDTSIMPPVIGRLKIVIAQGGDGGQVTVSAIVV